MANLGIHEHALSAISRAATNERALEQQLQVAKGSRKYLSCMAVEGAFNDFAEYGVVGGERIIDMIEIMKRAQGKPTHQARTEAEGLAPHLLPGHDASPQAALVGSASTHSDSGSVAYVLNKTPDAGTELGLVQLRPASASRHGSYGLRVTGSNTYIMLPSAILPHARALRFMQTEEAVPVAVDLDALAPVSYTDTSVQTWFDYSSNGILTGKALNMELLDYGQETGPNVPNEHEVLRWELLPGISGVDRGRYRGTDAFFQATLRQFVEFHLLDAEQVRLRPGMLPIGLTDEVRAQHGYRDDLDLQGALATQVAQRIIYERTRAVGYRQRRIADKWVAPVAQTAQRNLVEHPLINGIEIDIDDVRSVVKALLT